ncbi:exonuclease SbcCD subunit D [Nocardioides bruguierae]|uniref:exonuclease SbcCD subunit D n=1 Tax=Nocardioides bruguierae TaxID=2945102 RepID=UPI00202276C6|nr:exonuclease SbcCD subunit D [Nocardioides bruguierae]MCL8025946.1 exonuclease SbcCD subunit D [Nocardioides bruguierae]
MRLLHTSDWHLGRSFHREGMLDHQAAWVDHLLEVVAAEEVDVVLVSGDVYDRALPQVDAVRLADETLARLAASRARVVLTSGNHDSAQRLGFGSRLADAAGVHLRTRHTDVGVPVLLEDEHGPVAVHGLPYLDPEGTRTTWGLPARSHEAALGEAMRRVRGDLAGRGGTRSVVMAHAFVAGGVERDPSLESDSERDISVGGVSIVPSSTFAGSDYVALGHLHGRHVLDERVRYSGSPLAYSFSEAGHTKGSWLVDLGAPAEGGAAVSATFVPAPVPRPLARLRGTLDELLSDPRHAHAEDAWVQAVLTDEGRPAAAMDRLRRRFPHALVLSFEHSAAPVGGLPAAPSSGRSDHDVVAEFVTAMRGRAPEADEAALLRRAVDACCEDPDADPVPAAPEQVGA